MHASRQGWLTVTRVGLRPHTTLLGDSLPAAMLHQVTFNRNQPAQPQESLLSKLSESCSSFVARSYWLHQAGHMTVEQCRAIADFFRNLRDTFPGLAYSRGDFRKYLRQNQRNTQSRGPLPRKLRHGWGLPGTPEVRSKCALGIAWYGRRKNTIDVQSRGTVAEGWCMCTSGTE